MQAKAAPDREDRIKQRAYEIWEMEGRPHGRDKEHWERAVREMEDDQAVIVAPPVAELMPPVAKPEAQQGGSSLAKRGGRASVPANGVADRRV